MSTDGDMIGAAVPNIQSLLKQGKKDEAWEIIEDLVKQGIKFPRLAEVKKDFFSDSKRWKWGQWGPDDDLVGKATVSVENSFLKNAGMLMGTKGRQMGRHLAAMAAKVQGALYSAAMDTNTCPLCQALDDLQCDYPSPEFFKYSPPQHCFCNCIWIYIDNEEEGYEADKDWDKQIIDKTGSTPGELIDKHGHANSWYEQNDRKDIKDILVSYRVLEKAVKNLGQGLKEKAQAEKGLDGSSEEGKPPTETEGTGEKLPSDTEKILKEESRNLPQPSNKGIPKVIKRLPEEDTLKEFVKENLRIPIRGFRKGEDKLIEDVLNRVPSHHLEDLKSINVVNNPIIVIRENKPVLARADYDRLTAEIEINRKLVDLSPRKNIIESKSRRTILHEIGHHFYVRNISESLKQEFKDIALREKLLLFKDKYFDDIEYFAAAYIEWHEQRKALARRYPEVYNILKRVIEVVP